MTQVPPLLIHNGPILTMNPAQPLVDAVLLRDGKIAAVGDEAHVRSAMTGTFELIDLGGRLATPGLNDAHAHIMGSGFAQAQIPLFAPEVTSIFQIKDLVGQAGQGDPHRSMDRGSGV